MDAIRVESIVKHFGNVVALDNTSISIAQGELFFLLGSSGCGKTTLLRCIAGLESPDSGVITFNGQDMTQVPTHKREAAMVFQSYALWPHMSVGENIAFGLKEQKVPKDEIKERVDEALIMVQLDGYASRRIDELSGGQQQRVALARALVIKPTCLLLDEPLSNLDAKLRAEMREEIRRIVKENNLTAIYVTHDQEEALSMADRIAVMDQGQIIQIGQPNEIYRNPINAHIASFLGNTNLIEAEIKRHVWANEEGGKHHTVHIKSLAGEFEGRVTIAGWHPEPGEPVLLSIRPEAFAPTQIGVPTNNIYGQIETRTYLGNSVQYGMLDESGHLWQIMELNPREMREIGDYISVSVNPSDVLVLQATI